MLHNHVGVMKNPLHHDQSESSQAIAFTSLNVVNIFHHQGRGGRGHWKCLCFIMAEVGDMMI